VQRITGRQVGKKKEFNYRGLPYSWKKGGLCGPATENVKEVSVRGRKYYKNRILKKMEETIELAGVQGGTTGRLVQGGERSQNKSLEPGEPLKINTTT